VMKHPLIALYSAFTVFSYFQQIFITCENPRRWRKVTSVFHIVNAEHNLNLYWCIWKYRWLFLRLSQKCNAPFHLMALNLVQLNRKATYYTLNFKNLIKFTSSLWNSACRDGTITCNTKCYITRTCHTAQSILIIF
jgi:hypothetical protein